MKAQAVRQLLADTPDATYSPEGMADGDTKMELVRFRVTPKQKEFLERAAKKETLNSSSWARRVLIKEAERILGEPAPEL